MKSIGVIGAGAWGTALAQTQAREGRDTILWARESEVAAAINAHHENTHFLPKIALDERLKATNDIHEAAKQDIILIVTPAQFARATLEEIKDDIPEGKDVVICSKGVELETGLMMSQMAEQVVPQASISVLTGPNFARELASGLPGACTIGVPNNDKGVELQDALGSKYFRPYATDDILGAQLGGAIKNVIAIACGIVTGRKFGESARAALLTRGVAEVARLGVAMGAQRVTLLGMCGIGDLMLTASSMQSRNFSLGVRLGEGESIDDILGPRKSVTEGVTTAQATLKLAKQHAVDMPITEAVNKTLNEGMPIDEAIQEMLNRPFKYDMKGREKRQIEG